MKGGTTIDGGAPHAPPRARDRALLTGVLVSVGIHALFLVAFILAAARTGTDATLRTDGRGSGFDVTLVTLPESAPPAMSSAPVPKGDAAASSAPTQHSAAPNAAASAPERSERGTLTSATPQAADVSGAGASVATAQSQSFSDPGAGDDYRRRLFDHIAAYRRSPAPVIGVAPNGMVMVRFSLTRSGDVLMVMVARSSGFPDLDQAAVDTIWRAGPMPSIPLTLPERVSVVLPVSFGGIARSPG